MSMSPTFSKWTNLLALAACASPHSLLPSTHKYLHSPGRLPCCSYPVGFHCIAALFTFLHTRPQSFWTALDSPARKLAREQRARLEEPKEGQAAPGFLPSVLRTPSVLRVVGEGPGGKEAAAAAYPPMAGAATPPAVGVHMAGGVETPGSELGVDSPA